MAWVMKLVSEMKEYSKGPILDTVLNVVDSLLKYIYFRRTQHSCHKGDRKSRSSKLLVPITK
jgi:hypothetical protein